MNTIDKLIDCISFAKRTNLIKATAVFITVLIWCFVTFKLIEERKFAIESGRASLQNVAIGLKLHTQATLKASDDVLRILKYHYESSGLNDLNLAHRYFEQGALDIKFLNQAGIIDEHGTYVFSSMPNHKRVDLSDREHFKVHKAGYGYPLFVSKPVLGRATGKWSFQLTRRLNKPDGTFKGVATASLNPNDFLDSFKGAQLGTDSVIGLVGTDGYARTMRVGNTNRVDDTLRDLNLPIEMKEQQAGYFFSDNLFDRTERMYVYQRLADMPLVALVGIKQDVALTDYERQKTTYLICAFVLTLLIILLTWYKLRCTNRTEQICDRLSEYEKMIAQFRQVKQDYDTKIAATQAMASVGQLAINFSSDLKSTLASLDSIHQSLERHTDTYESFFQALVRLQMGQIAQNEFFSIVKNLELEVVIDGIRLNLREAELNLEEINLFVDLLKNSGKH
jgi:two-component system, NarL family, sensor histidine kinase BarA